MQIIIVCLVQTSCCSLFSVQMEAVVGPAKDYSWAKFCSVVESGGDPRGVVLSAVAGAAAATLRRAMEDAQAVALGQRGLHTNSCAM